MEAKNDKVVVFSVVRDQDMYLRCLLGNHFLKGCVLKKVDNATDNQPVTKRYNDFLDSLEEDCWVVLCHEDWEVKERLYDVVKNFDPAYLYGPIGVFVEERETVDVIVPMGYVSQSTKNDRKEIVIRGKEFEGRVDTFDCQCLILPLLGNTDCGSMSICLLICMWRISVHVPMRGPGFSPAP